MTDDARVPVTVEDREAAAMIAHALGRHIKESAFRQGRLDYHPVIQRIARHRLAGVAAGREEAWKVVEARLTQVQQAAIDAGRHHYLPAEQAVVNFATDAMSAIRQMGGEVTTMENNMKKLILAVALLFTPAALDAARPKPPKCPIHCGPGYCDCVIRPW